MKTDRSTDGNDYCYWARGSYAALCIENGMRAIEKAPRLKCWCGLPREQHRYPEADFRPRGVGHSK